MSTGRGGAGNAIRTTPSQLTRGVNATGPASATQAAQAIRTSLTSTKPTYASSTTSSRRTPAHNYSTGGRGGAGNFFPSSERTIFSFDEELERQLRWERDVAPVYHVGRGGAGNLIHSPSSFAQGEKMIPVTRRRASEDSGASMASNSSHGSESGADAFNRSVVKGWKKFTGSGF